MTSNVYMYCHRSCKHATCTIAHAISKSRSKREQIISHTQHIEPKWLWRRCQRPNTTENESHQHFHLIEFTHFMYRLLLTDGERIKRFDFLFILFFQYDRWTCMTKTMTIVRFFVFRKWPLSIFGVSELFKIKKKSSVSHTFLAHLPFTMYVTLKQV